MRDFIEDVKLNKLALDQAAERQADLMGHYGTEVANAQKARDEAKNRLRLRKGEVRIELKRQGLDGKAPTREDLDAMVESHPEIDGLYRNLAQAEFDLELAYAQKTAIEANKSMIEVLQRLHGASYFATPSTGNRENLPAYRPGT